MVEMVEIVEVGMLYNARKNDMQLYSANQE